MSEHFGAIGLQLPDEGALLEFLGDLGNSLVEELRRGKDRHLRWQDSSGASLAVHVEGESISCVTPFFVPADGLTRWRVRTVGPRDDAECRHCGGADCDLLDESGELLSRATVQWLVFAPYRKWLGVERSYNLEVSAFAHELRVFNSEANFAAADLHGLKLASNAFLQIGLFQSTTHLGTAAVAQFAGRVAIAERLTNTRGSDFWHLRVETLPGALDVVAAPNLLQRPPCVGDLALASGWLVGRPTEPPPGLRLLQRLGFGG